MFGALFTRAGNRLGWRALNRRNLDFFDRVVADDVVYDVSGPPPFGGRFVGKAAWRAANQRWMDSLASFRFRVLHEGLSRPYAFGFTNTVLTEYELVQTTPDGRTLRTLGIDVSELRRGKLVAARNYLFDTEAAAALMQPVAGAPAVAAPAVDEPPKPARRRRGRTRPGVVPPPLPTG